jgi:hypothetical protein
MKRKKVHFMHREKVVRVTQCTYSENTCLVQKKKNSHGHPNSQHFSTFSSQSDLKLKVILCGCVCVWVCVWARARARVHGRYRYPPHGKDFLIFTIWKVSYLNYNLFYSYHGGGQGQFVLIHNFSYLRNKTQIILQAHLLKHCITCQQMCYAWLTYEAFNAEGCTAIFKYLVNFFLLLATLTAARISFTRIL